MDNVNKTLYIPLHGKSYVSKKGIILSNKKAEEIWEKEGFALKGKSKSKWLAYFMAMRAAVFDDWLSEKLERLQNAQGSKKLESPNNVVLHIGCGLDSRILRVANSEIPWYDIDFEAVINERQKYFCETKTYHMLPFDMRKDDWKSAFDKNTDAIIILEGVSMYFSQDELTNLLSNFHEHFRTVKLLMDCYTKRGEKASKYKNPISDVGVTTVCGYDDPKELEEKSCLKFVKEHSMTPSKYINQLKGTEKIIFKNLFAGKFAKSLYKIYEFKK